MHNPFCTLHKRSHVFISKLKRHSVNIAGVAFVEGIFTLTCVYLQSNFNR